MNNDQANNINAALIIIGNEILSGRTQDKNLNYIATSLVELGINLVEVRVIKDIEIDIEGFISGLINKLVVIGETLDDNYFKITNYPVIKKSSTSKQNQ